MNFKGDTIQSIAHFIRFSPNARYFILLQMTLFFSLSYDTFKYFIVNGHVVNFCVLIL